MQCRHSHTTLAALWWRCSGDGWTHACTRASFITLIFNKTFNTHLNNSIICLSSDFPNFNSTQYIYLL